MPSESEPVEATEREIAAHLMQAYGPLLGREQLTQVLGFASIEAFDRCVQRGHLGLDVIRFPNRRGVYALAHNVAAYLFKISLEASGPKKKRSDADTP